MKYVRIRTLSKTTYCPLFPPFLIARSSDQTGVPGIRQKIRKHCSSQSGTECFMHSKNKTKQLPRAQSSFIFPNFSLISSHIEKRCLGLVFRHMAIVELLSRPASSQLFIQLRIVQHPARGLCVHGPDGAGSRYKPRTL